MQQKMSLRCVTKFDRMFAKDKIIKHTPYKPKKPVLGYLAELFHVEAVTH